MAETSIVSSGEDLRSLRIVMIIPYDLYYEPFTIRTIMFAAHLADRGHQVHVFYRDRPKGKRGNRIHDHLPETFTVSSFNRWRLADWRKLSQAVAEADLVHFQKARPLSTALALLYSRLHRKPLHQDWDDDDLAFCLEVLRDSMTSSMSLKTRLERFSKALFGTVVIGSLEWAIPKLVDTMGGASMTLRRKTISRGCPPALVFPARVGVDVEQFHPGRRDEALRARLGLTGPTVLYSGYFDGHEDLRFFVEALRALIHEAPDARCLVIGGGTGRARLVELLRKSGLEKTVVMTEGFIPFREMPRHVASCDIAALPLRDTPVNRSKSSLTLLECMACGLPAVTNDVGDMGWMLGGCGEIAAKADPGDFGRKLALLAQDAKRRNELAKKARERAVQRFTWDKTVDFLEQAYRQALAARGRSGLQSVRPV